MQITNNFEAIIKGNKDARAYENVCKEAKRTPEGNTYCQLILTVVERLSSFEISRTYTKIKTIKTENSLYNSRYFKTL